MSRHTETKRFYYTHANQRKTIAILGLFWAVTFLYGTMLRNRTLGVTFMFMSLIYPLVILVSYLQNLKTLNYADVDSEGILTTYLGMFHRMTRWAEIESMTEVTINGAEAIGITFLPEYKRHGLSVSTSVRISGYEGLLRQGVAADGQTFTEWANAHLIHSSPKGSKRSGAVRQTVKTEPVQIKQSFKLSDLWSKPYAAAWVGVSLVCDILAGMFKHGNHVLGSVFGVIGVISMGIAGASLIRFRRTSDEVRGQQKTKKPNNWSNLS